MEALGYNPIHCLDCNLEVPPESLPLDTALVEAIANWRALYAAISWLWLDSEEYEAWAAAQLKDIQSPVNNKGRQVQRSLNEIHRCYYWYFQEPIEAKNPPIRSCPGCRGSLAHRPSRIGPMLVCEGCSIVASGS
jgi:predicted  nucleic acid-binding Zn ribbon protein